MMTRQQAREPAAPPPTPPFNRRLLAQGRDAPPTGSLHHNDTGHFRMQEWLGIVATLGVFFLIVYGVTRDMVDSALAIGAVAAGMILAPHILPKKARTWRKRASR